MINIKEMECGVAELADILLRIGEFAERIECRSFGNIFRNARDMLNGKQELPHRYSNGSTVYLPDVPEGNKRMFHASSMADVFGAMGSWNDEPPYWVHQKGLDEAYDSLSNELLKQIRLAVLYAVNEDQNGGKEETVRVKTFKYLPWLLLQI